MILIIYSKMSMIEYTLHDLYVKHDTKKQLTLADFLATPFFLKTYQQYKSKMNYLFYGTLIIDFFYILILISLVTKTGNTLLLLIYTVISGTSDTIFKNNLMNNIVYLCLFFILTIIKEIIWYKRDKLYRKIYHKSVNYFLDLCQAIDMGKLKNLDLTRLLKMFKMQINNISNLPIKIAHELLLYYGPVPMLITMLLLNSIVNTIVNINDEILVSFYARFKYYLYYHLPLKWQKVWIFLCFIAFYPLLLKILLRESNQYSIEHILDQLSSDINSVYYFNDDIKKLYTNSYFNVLDSAYCALSFLTIVFLGSISDLLEVISHISNYLLKYIYDFMNNKYINDKHIAHTIENYKKQLFQHYKDNENIKKEINNVHINNIPHYLLIEFIGKDPFVLFCRAFFSTIMKKPGGLLIIYMMEKLIAIDFYISLNKIAHDLNKNTFNSVNQQNTIMINTYTKLNTLLIEKVNYNKEHSLDIDKALIEMLGKKKIGGIFNDNFAGILPYLGINQTLYYELDELKNLLTQMINSYSNDDNYLKNINNIKQQENIRNTLFRILENRYFHDFLNKPINIATNNIFLNYQFMFMLYVLLIYFIFYPICNSYINILENTRQFNIEKIFMKKSEVILNSMEINSVENTENIEYSINLLPKVQIDNFTYCHRLDHPDLLTSIFNKTDFHMEEGINTIVGASGSGKSSLLYILMKHFNTKGSSNINYDSNTPMYSYIGSKKNVNLHKLSRENLSNSLSFIPQQIKFDNNCTINEIAYLLLGDLFTKQTYQNTLRYILDIQGLKYIKFSRHLYSLSGGEKQRVSIGLLLLNYIAQNHRLILADEPTTFIDSYFRDTINNIILNKINDIKINQYYNYINTDINSNNEFYNNYLDNDNYGKDKFINFQITNPVNVVISTHNPMELISSFNINCLHILSDDKKIIKIPQNHKLYQKLLSLLKKQNINDHILQPNYIESYIAK